MFFELTGNRGAHSNDGKCSLREHEDLGASLFRQKRHLRMEDNYIHMSFEFPQLSVNSFVFKIYF